MKTLIQYQTAILAFGTLFAWGNFSIEFMRWMKQGQAVGCTGTIVANPFASACFYGAVFFTVAFILNIGMLRRLAQNEQGIKKD